MEVHQFRIAFLFFVLFNAVVAQQGRLSSNSEWRALLGLRSSLGIRARDWRRKVDPCSKWTGVKCREGRVIGINLSGLTRTRQGRINPRFDVDSLANFTTLEVFNSSGFSLPGSIPDWFGQRLSALQVLDLSSSSILGLLPSSLGSLSMLSHLSLSNNSIAGTIPPALGKLFFLESLDLSRNELAGSIPNAFSALQNLTSLNLSSNYLSGSIPIEFGSLHSLRSLDLSSNSVSGSIPDQLANLSQLVELDLGQNYLSGSLPEVLGRLRSLEKLLVGNNQLEGAIPVSLFSNLTRLKDVVLRGNNLGGELPDNFLSMSHLRFLDISGNNFTGGFPNLMSFNATGASFNFSNNKFYGNLTSEIGNFRSIDLSSNYFQGFVPSNVGSSVNITNNCLQKKTGQRNPEDCRMFYTNQNGPVPIPLQETHSRKNRLVYILVGVFGGFIVLLLLAIIALYWKKRSSRTPIQSESANVRPVQEAANTAPPDKASVDLSALGELFMYEKVLEATNHFSDTNFMTHGQSGDIYRGMLENGCPVAIKKLNLQSLENKSYILELEFYRDFNHPRLIPLLGHCLDQESDKCLIYKYMPNGDLSNLLYRVSNSEGEDVQSLDWITRLKIAIGTAEALSYLHHECYPPLVHRDIQSSSILLDDKYEVRLGSLSKVCVQGSDNRENMISKFLRIPQSSGKGMHSMRKPPSSNCAYDVYCFGKVLLELVTGKVGISKPDDNSTKEWLERTLPFVSISEREKVAGIVDQSMIVDEDLLEEVWAVAVVAKSCLNPRPSRRPIMRHVLKALESPFKVVRQDFSSGKLRTASSRRSWTSAFFGSWRHSSSDSTNASQGSKEGTSGVKQTSRLGSHSSGNEHSSSRNKSSSEIFPEPVESHDLERQDTSQLSREL
nr:probable LRR receptor-like serine/threonine-protein kinase At2g16250 [Ipomoea trifida]